MTTDKHRAAARANGAKSHGPKTPQGKARSSRNACQHGLAAAQFVTIPGEDPAQYAALLLAYQERFRPIDLVEFDQVELLAMSSWYIRRATAAQRLTLLVSADEHRAAIDRIWNDVDEFDHSAWAVARETSNPQVLNLQRYIAHWRRQHRVALLTLRDLQANRPQPFDPAFDQDAGVSLDAPGEPAAAEPPAVEPEKRAVLQNEPKEHVTPAESVACLSAPGPFFTPVYAPGPPGCPRRNLLALPEPAAAPPKVMISGC